MYTDINHYWRENKDYFIRNGIPRSAIVHIWTDAVHTTAEAINQSILSKMDT